MKTKQVIQSALAGLVVFCFASNNSYALTLALKGSAGQELFVDSYEKGGKDAFLVKFSGVKSKWANQVILTKRVGSQTSESYSFEYELELSDGIHKRTFVMLVQSGTTLDSGSVVRRFELSIPESLQHPVLLLENSSLGEKSKNLDLAGEYLKKKLDWS